MKNLYKVLIALLMLPLWLLAQDMGPIEYQGRWAEGKSNAVFYRNNLTFVGNGALLQLYESTPRIGGGTTYGQVVDGEILLDEVIEDLWVPTAMNVVYAACGEAGIFIIQFDAESKTFGSILGSVNTDGYASGLFQLGSYLYVADGMNGVLIYNVSDPNAIRFRSRTATGDFARDLWLHNGEYLLVAAESSGLYSLDVTDRVFPTKMDSLTFSELFPTPDHQYPSLAWDVIANDTAAYVSSRYGGLNIVNIKNLNDLKSYGRWTWHGTPTDVRSAFFSGDKAYIAAGEDGFFSGIDISDATNPTGPIFPPLNENSLPTPLLGTANDVVIVADTAYVVSAEGGHQRIDITANIPPRLDTQIDMGDDSHDAILNGKYAYVAAGNAGLKILDLELGKTADDLFLVKGSWDTGGPAYRLYQRSVNLIVAQADQGISVLNTSDPGNPILDEQWDAVQDSCHDVHMPAGSLIYLAAGRDGMRVVDLSQSPIQEVANGHVSTVDPLRGIYAEDNKAYLAAGSHVLVYDVTGLSSAGTPVLLDSLEWENLDARDLVVSSDTVAVANGRYGVLLWNRSTDQVDTLSFGSVVTDVKLKGRTLYAACGEDGMKILDLSRPGEFAISGTYDSNGFTNSVFVNGNDIAVADEIGGFVYLTAEIQPEIWVSTDNINFGPVAPGKSRSMKFMIQNTGATLLTGAFSLANHADMISFSQDDFAVPPGDTTFITVTFAPPIGAKDGTTLTIASNDRNNPTVSINLQWSEGIIADELTPYSDDLFTNALYHFNETGGTAFYDISGNNLTGQTMGNTDFVASNKFNFGNSLRCYGEDVNGGMVPYNEKLDISGGAFTIEFWFNMAVRPDTTDHPIMIMLQRGRDTAKQYQIALANEKKSWVTDEQGGLMAYCRGATKEFLLNTGSIDELALNHWNHVALSSDQEFLRLYLNGVLRDSTALTEPLVAAADEDLGVGDAIGGRWPFNGKLDELRISNVARQDWEFHVNHSALTLAETQLDFGAILLGEKRSLPLYMHNPGSENLEVQSVDVAQGSASVSLDIQTGFSIEPGATRTLWVTYEPSSTADLEDRLVINSSDPTTPVYEVTLAGSGITSIPAGRYRKDALTLGLWHFDEVGGSVFHDSSSSKLDGDWPSMDFTATGQFGRALNFVSGQNRIGTVSMIDSIDLVPRWGGFTIEGWVFSTVASDQKQLIVARGNDAEMQFEIYLQGGVLYAAMFDTAGVGENRVEVTSAGLAAWERNDWVHMALSCGDGKLTLFINGDKIDEEDFAGPLNTELFTASLDTAGIRFGRQWDGSQTFTGRLDEFRLSTVNRQRWEFNVDMARVAFSADTLDYDRVPLGESRTLKVSVTNEGIGDLEITNILASPTVFVNNISQFTVAPGRSEIVEITYTPNVAGEVTGTLYIESNDPFASQANIALKARGVATFPKQAYENDAMTSLLFSFEASSGSGVADSSAYASSGVLTGGTWGVEGRYGRALALDGINDRVTVDTLPGVDAIMHEFTIETWFYIDGKSSEQAILFQRGTGEKNQLELKLHPSLGIVAATWDSAGVKDSLVTGSTGQLALKRWYHTALKWNGDTLALYLNNIKSSEMTWHRVLAFDADDSAWLGARNDGSNGFDGRLDDFRVSSVARQDWEINVKDRELEVSPTVLDFATVLQDQERTLQVGVHNLGDQDLVVTSVSGGGDYFSFPDSLQSFVLGRAEAKAIPVIYKPTEANVNNLDSLIVLADGQRVVVKLQGASTEARQMAQYGADSHTIFLYHFNEPGGTVANDSSGQEHHGLISGGAFVDGLFQSNALEFDGVDDYLTVPYSNDFDFDLSRQDYTLECYFQTDTVSQVIIAFGQRDSARFALGIDNVGHVVAQGFGSGGGPKVNDGAWHHAALMFDHIEQKGRLFIDGQETWNRSWTGHRSVLTDTSLIIGAQSPTSRHFRGRIEELRLSDIPRERWEFQFIEYGIETVEPTIVTAGVNCTLGMDIPRVISPASGGVRLYYRAAGGQSYEEMATTSAADTFFSAVIPGEDVKSRGLEYYFSITTTNGDVITHPMLDPVNNPISLPVHHNGMTADISFIYREYEMVSVPYILNHASSDSVLKDLGRYNPYEWELYWWHPSVSQQRLADALDTVYVHVSDSLNGLTFTPGKAFWMATSHAETFNIGGGVSVSTDTSYQITLKPGWNMIANPYAFPVAWRDCSLSDSTSNLYFYDSARSDRPIQNWSHLVPWKGYWVHNPQGHDVYLTVRPKENQPPASLNLAKRSKSLKAGEWMIRLSAESKESRDVYNYAGMRGSASDIWDIQDQPETPSIKASQDLYFDHQDWEVQPGDYCSDIRALNEEGAVYHFNVQMLSQQKSTTVKWALENELPQGWKGYIFNLYDGTSQCITDASEIKVKTRSSGMNLAFKLVVGTDGFLEEHRDEIPLGPVEFELAQNYPNPFNPETTIRYSVHKRGQVEIDIYNSLGQHVRSLVDQESPAGHFETMWDGHDKSGIQVASGVYLCRLKVAGKVAIRKMVLLR